MNTHLILNRTYGKLPKSITEGRYTLISTKKRFRLVYDKDEDKIIQEVFDTSKDLDQTFTLRYDNKFIMAISLELPHKEMWNIIYILIEKMIEYDNPQEMINSFQSAITNLESLKEYNINFFRSDEDKYMLNIREKFIFRKI